MGVTLQELSGLVGEEFGTSDWLTVTQDMIDEFAEATHDDQWIHTDPDRAADGPFGTTIAHGYLTLSLVPVLAHQVLEVEDIGMGINYGLNRVRFPAPVPSGARVRGRVSVVDVEALDDGAVQVTSKVIVEVEDVDKPACVAEPVSRYYPA